MKRKENKTRKSIRVMVAAMAVVIAAGMAGSYGYQRSQITAKAAEIDTEELQEVAENALPQETDEADADSDQGARKEESVYVKADSEGNVKTTTVTEWLKNTGNGALADVSELEDIKNIKGDETYETSGEDGLEWQAAGDDIYYQGTTEKSLPVGVKISYKLDGKSISAEDLKGKDGKVEIHIQYSNTSSEEVDVDGTSEEMFTPFTMITAMMLSTDEYENVEIDNGKVISDAERQIVVGLGFPGLNENLQLEDSDYELPEDVTITADVKHASVGPTITVATTDFLESLDLDSIDSFDDLGDSMEELEDATNQLVDGSKEASDGAQQLADGADQLAAGASTLNSGISTLNQKSGDLISGVDALNTGITSYTQGVQALSDGITQAGLASGAQDLQSGASAVSAGVQAVSEAVDQLKTGADTAAAGATTLDGVLADDGALAGAINAIGSSATLTVDSDGLEAYLKTVLSDPNQASAVADALKGYFTVADSQLETGKGTALAVLKQAKSGADQLTAGVNSIDGGLAALQTNIDGENGLAAGSQAVAAGAEQISGGISTVQAGVDQLKDSNAALSGGAAALVNGGSQLASGVGQLAAGAGTLDVGAGTLADGAAALADGNAALADGMSEYKTDAIDKLTSMFDGDITKISARLKAMTNLGKEYKSFAGIRTEMNGTTKFIIETEGVEG